MPGDGARADPAQRLRAVVAGQHQVAGRKRLDRRARPRGVAISAPSVKQMKTFSMFEKVTIVPSERVTDPLSAVV